MIKHVTTKQFDDLKTVSRGKHTAALLMKLFRKTFTANFVDIEPNNLVGFVSTAGGSGRVDGPKGDETMTVIACSNCGTKNRVDPRQAAEQVAKCGKCGTPLELSQTGGPSQETKPFIVTDATFQSAIQESRDLPILVDAWAPWCGPCRMVGPIMEQLAAESNGRYRIAKLNVDENPRTASQFQIQSIPTMLVFKNGSLVDRIVGAQPKPAIAARLLSHVT